MRGWFKSDGRTLRPHPQAIITALKKGEPTLNILHPGQRSFWEGHREVKARFIEWMLGLRESNVGLNSLLITFQMKAFLLARAPGVCAKHGGKLKVSCTFVRTWAKDRLVWSFHKPINNASKLPLDWEKRGELLTLKIACLVSIFLIPPSLVINVDQTTVHLLLVGNERTYATHRARDVKVAGRGDMRRVIALVSCAATGDVLPIEVIFQGKTE